jgi:hypothetical protein
MSPLKREVERMLAERRSFDAIEDRIDRMSCTDDLKAALWLFAWNQQARVDRDRTIDQALTLAAQPQG